MWEDRGGGREQEEKREGKSRLVCKTNENFLIKKRKSQLNSVIIVENISMSQKFLSVCLVNTNPERF